MKLYSRSQLVKSTFLGIGLGAFVALAGVFYFSHNPANDRKSSEAAELSGPEAWKCLP